MGATAGTLRREQAVSSAKHSRKIDADIAKERNDAFRKFKILLLGGSECGKTTIFKQMRILHLNGFTEEMLAEYRSTIHRNAAEALEQLLHACETFKYRHEISTQEDIKRFHDYTKTITIEDANVVIPVVISRCMERIWNTNQLQSAYVRRFNFPLLDSAKYFLDNISRIGETNYSPSQQDILFCRFRTAGISEISFEYKNIKFLMVDVGGQRTERRKWIHCFDNVDMLMFVIAMSDYDQHDPEDLSQNRMLQNFEIFKTIVASDMFRSASIVLFLNKHDIFVEKLRTVPLTRCFHGYKGDNTETDASEYVKRQFGRYVQHKHRFFSFNTRATDTDHIDRVFTSAVSHIVTNNLRATGLHSE